MDQPGIVVKMNLATGNRVGSITLNEGEVYLSCAVVDTANSYAYYGTYTSPGKVVKIDITNASVDMSHRVYIPVILK
jgi:hypothetical protein